MTTAEGKLDALRSLLRNVGKAVVAFSAGVDSTFLLRVAHDEMGDGAIAATARSRLFPSHELDEAIAFCRDVDDDGDFRPGRRAIMELGILSPLHDVGLGKAEIRALSRRMDLPTAGKPSFACLASRFPYGERITDIALERVERAEQWLHDSCLGPAQLRVRSHGDLARIEVAPDDIARVAAKAGEISAALRSFGFKYVSLDLEGYRTGSMNETLPSTATG